MFWDFYGLEKQPFETTSDLCFLYSKARDHSAVTCSDVAGLESMSLASTIACDRPSKVNDFC